MELVESLEALARQNHYGVSFLIAYASTWIACGILWRTVSNKNAGLATLFQGMVAFPIAIGLSYVIGALGQDRPVEEVITQLSIYIGSSQMLGIPFLIYLFTKRRYVLLPYAFAVICAMHFMLYSWLYQTPFYVIMAAVISVGGMIIMIVASDDQQAQQHTASNICLFVGATMLLTSLVLLAI